MRINSCGNYYKSGKNISFNAKSIAVTGNIAAGKSTVQKLFEQNNIKSIDVDEVVHKLYSEDSETINSIKEMFQSFGIHSLDGDDYIDRKKIRTLVFRDENIKKALEDIVHPAVNKKVAEFLKQNEESDYVAVFIPLLFETNQQKDFDYIVMIKVDPDVQLERLLKRNSFLTLETALERINSQMSQEVKSDKADFVIDNSGNFEQTKRQVENVIQTLKYRCAGAEYPVKVGDAYKSAILRQKKS